jgi:hypothetical protein
VEDKSSKIEEHIPDVAAAVNRSKSAKLIVHDHLQGNAADSLISLYLEWIELNYQR